jgi:hypothetical protein
MVSEVDASLMEFLDRKRRLDLYKAVKQLLVKLQVDGLLCPSIALATIQQRKSFELWMIRGAEKNWYRS